MELLSLAAAIVLSIAFGAAAFGKLLIFDRTRSSMMALGVPAHISKITVILVSLAEILSALLLLMPISRSVGAALALLLMGGFTGVLFGNLAAGNRPACNCFGGSSDSPIGINQVIRNVVLTFLAAFVLAIHEGRTLVELALILMGAALVGLISFASVVLRLTRRAADAANESDPPYMPSLQPETGHGWIGESITSALSSPSVPAQLLGTLREHRVATFVFTSSSCSRCRNVKELLANSALIGPVVFVCPDEETIQEVKGAEGILEKIVVEDFTSATMRHLGFDLLPTVVFIEDGTVIDWAVSEEEIARKAPTRHSLVAAS